MTTAIIAKIMFSIFVFIGGLLAAGKLIAEHNERKGHCDIK